MARINVESINTKSEESDRQQTTEKQTTKERVSDRDGEGERGLGNMLSPAVPLVALQLRYPFCLCLLALQ